jgi:hypothetical protein
VPPCPSCHREVAIEALLASCQEYWPWLDAGLFICPQCQAPSEVRLQSGRMWFGYIYAAGSAHFSPEDQHLVPGLRVWVDGEELHASLDEIDARIPLLRPG